jgi:hypothetical protein
VIKLGGHGRKVFKDIIALSDKWRALTNEQRLQFIDLSSKLSSIGVSGG